MIVKGFVDVGGVRLWLGPAASSRQDAAGKHWIQSHTWHDSGDSKAKTVEQPAASGAFPLARAWRESVLVSFEGFSLAESRAEYQRLRDELMALGAETAGVRVRFVDGGEDTWRLGHVASVDCEPDHGRNWFKWTLDVRCVDPRRYGRVESRRETLSAGGSQYSLAANGRPSNPSGWWVSTGAGVRVPAIVSGGWASTGDRGLRSRLALFYRVESLTYRVRRVRVWARGIPETAKARLSLSWLKSGVLRRVDALTPQMLASGDGVVFDAPEVQQPENVDGLTVGLEAYDPSLEALSRLDARFLMVGAFTDSDFQDGDSLGWAWLGQPGQSPTAQLGTRWLLDNRAGTAPSTPAITVTAKRQMLGGFTLSFYGSEDKLVYSGDIAAGSVVELVPGEHAVLIDGKLSPVVAVGRWPAVPPGELVQLSLTANNTTDFEATATWSPAWW